MRQVYATYRDVYGLYWILFIFIFICILYSLKYFMPNQKFKILFIRIGLEMNVTSIFSIFFICLIANYFFCNVIILKNLTV